MTVGNLMSKLDDTYATVRKAIDEMHLALDGEENVLAREYYRGQQRPIDEASREDAKKIAEQMQACIKKRVPPSADDLNKWASILLKM